MTEFGVLTLVGKHVSRVRHVPPCQGGTPQHSQILGSTYVQIV